MLAYHDLSIDMGQEALDLSLRDYIYMRATGVRAVLLGCASGEEEEVLPRMPQQVLLSLSKASRSSQPGLGILNTMRCRNNELPGDAF